METIKINIKNEQALQIINNLNKLKLIEILESKEDNNSWFDELSGALSFKSLENTDKQLQDLRDSWQ